MRTNEFTAPKGACDHLKIPFCTIIIIHIKNNTTVVLLMSICIDLHHYRYSYG